MSVNSSIFACVIFNIASTCGILHKENHNAFFKLCREMQSRVALEILPLLYQDLLAGNPNTLEEYQVEYKHVIVEDLTN